MDRRTFVGGGGTSKAPYQQLRSNLLGDLRAFKYCLDKYPTGGHNDATGA
jgi:hypothetical protein